MLIELADWELVETLDALLADWLDCEWLLVDDGLELDVLWLDGLDWDVLDVLELVETDDVDALDWLELEWLDRLELDVLLEVLKLELELVDRLD